MLYIELWAEQMFKHIDRKRLCMWVYISSQACINAREPLIMSSI